MSSALNKMTVEDFDVKGKRVLVRCDFNVKMENGVITSDKRIVASLPTIQYLIKNGAKVILCSHLGRPKGQVNPEFSMKPVAARLSELLGLKVKMADDVVGPSAHALAASLKDGEVMLLENVRFEPGETKNDPELSKAFASLADLYVNDAFGSAHRAHSSTAGVAAYLPAACGYLIQKEIKFIGGALENPKRPLVAILGGAKVSDKIGVITNLIDKCDTLIIGGGMAYTFMKALGHSIGDSLLEADKVDLAKEMMDKALEMVKIITTDFEEGQIFKGKVVSIKEFGAFIEFAPGKEGMVHISKIAKERINRVEDVLTLGDVVTVVCLGKDKMGRISFSMKDVAQQ